MRSSRGKGPSSGSTRNVTSSDDIGQEALGSGVLQSSLNGSLYDLDVPIAMAEFALKYFRYHKIF